jgi:hypothetical protein
MGRFYAYHCRPGNECWGSLHIVLDDYNIEDHHVEFCIEWAEKKNDIDGADLARLLLRMTKTQRLKVSRLATDDVWLDKHRCLEQLFLPVTLLEPHALAERTGKVMLDAWGRVELSLPYGDWVAPNHIEARIQVYLDEKREGEVGICFAERHEVLFG